MREPSAWGARPGAVPIREAAGRLGIPRGWAVRLCEAGRFPARAFRVGAAWHVDRADLERHLRERGGGGRPGGG